MGIDSDERLRKNYSSNVVFLLALTVDNLSLIIIIAINLFVAEQQVYFGRKHRICCAYGK